MNSRAWIAALTALCVLSLAHCGRDDSADNANPGPANPSGDGSVDGSKPVDGSAPVDAHGGDAPAWPDTAQWPEGSVGDTGTPDVSVDAPVADGPDFDVNFNYDAPPPPTAWSQIPPKCADAAEKGVTWLVSQQKLDGSWGTQDPYRLAATGLAVVKLESYAIEKGFSPFDPAFVYQDNVIRGLTYLFQILVTKPMAGPYDTNGNSLGVTSNQSNYVTAIVLMAVTAGRGTTQVVNAPGSPVHGWTFATVAQDMVDYFAECQVASQGGWRYTCPSSNADNSVSQYVSLALEYANHPDYEFLCTIPPDVSTRLWTWVGYVQNMTPGTNFGGSGYTSAADGANPYRTGAILQQLAFLNQGPATPQSQAALTYLDTHWAEPMAGSPAYYMAMWSIMKGLVAQGVTMVGAHDWYDEYCDLLVSQQQVDGSWPLSQFDTAASEGVLSTTWALLILEKAAPKPQS